MLTKIRAYPGKCMYYILSFSVNLFYCKEGAVSCFSKQPKTNVYLCITTCYNNIFTAQWVITPL